MFGSCLLHSLRRTPGNRKPQHSQQSVVNGVSSSGKTQLNDDRARRLCGPSILLRLLFQRGFQFHARPIFKFQKLPVVRHNQFRSNAPRRFSSSSNKVQRETNNTRLPRCRVPQREPCLFRLCGAALRLRRLVVLSRRSRRSMRTERWLIDNEQQRGSQQAQNRQERFAISEALNFTASAPLTHIPRCSPQIRQ